MAYYIDLSKISLSEYKDMLLTRYIIPSQMILRDNIDENFKKIESSGIKDMAALKESLKSRTQAEKMAEKLSIPEEYVIVLRRETCSHHPPARNLDEYPTITNHARNVLGDMDVTRSDQLYPLLMTPSSRKSMSAKLQLTYEQALTVAKLMDVSRLRYVSPLFATLLVHSPYDTVARISKADPQEMYDDLSALNTSQTFFKGQLGRNDTLFLIQDTEHVDIDLIENE